MVNTELNLKSNQNRHQPFHLYLDRQIYFFTVHTYHDVPVLRSVKRKSEFIQRLKDVSIEKDCNFIAWVILDNHYHCLMKSKKGNDIQAFFQNIHGTTSGKIIRGEGRYGKIIGIVVFGAKWITGHILIISITIPLSTITSNVWRIMSSQVSIITPKKKDMNR